MGTILEVRDLVKKYGDFEAVKGITFDIREGEIFSLLGPNGAGKTTTIRMLLDLLRPTSGNMMVFGKAVDTDSEEIRARCGYLPGNFNVYGSMTGADFLRFAAEMRNITPELE